MTNWEIETIPDDSFLYYRIHKAYIRNNKPIPGVFRDIGANMSTNWDKYITPEECRAMSKNPNDNGVVQLNTGEIRHQIHHVVNHSPANHRSHTDVIGVKDTEARLKYLRICKWMIEIAI